MNQTAERTRLADASRKRNDPTGTSALRRTWRNVSEIKLRRLRADLRAAVVDQDVLGLTGAGTFAFQPEFLRLRYFNEWFDRRAKEALCGAWCAPYTRAAWQSGHAAAMRETGKLLPLPMDGGEALATLAEAETRGITAALVQQVSRAAVTATSQHMRPNQAYALLVEPFDKVALNRTRTNVDVVTVAAHNQAKIAAYREAGVTRVGIHPEMLRRHTHAPARVGDSRTTLFDRVHRGPGSRVPRDVTPSASTIYRIRKATEEIGGELGELVGVVTAGDDFVCEECEDIAAAGPYGLDEALSIIPAHIRCRCSFFPWGDERFAADALMDYSPDQPRDPDGKWSGGGSGRGGPSVALYHGTAAKYVESIRKHGLQPRMRGGADTWLRQQGSGYWNAMKALGGPKAAVYMTRSKRHVEAFANMTSDVTGTPAVILKLRVPKAVFAKHFREDVRFKKSGAYRTLKGIPPEWIVDGWILEETKFVPNGYGGFRRVTTPTKRLRDAVEDDSVELWALVQFEPEDDLDADQRLSDYRPDQERDEYGRWVEEGGGGEGEREGERHYEATSRLHGILALRREADRLPGVEIIKPYGEPVKVLVNPRLGELTRLVRENELRVARGVVDAKGNLYAWIGAVAAHEHVVGDLQLEMDDRNLGYFRWGLSKTGQLYDDRREADAENIAYTRELIDPAHHMEAEPEGTAPVSIPMSSRNWADLKEQFIETISKAGGFERLVDVPIADLRATQSTVNISGPEEGDAPIVGVMDATGKVHVINGHHRIERAIASGKASIQARVVDDTARHVETAPPLKLDNMTKVGPQMGSNVGGVYEDAQGQKFYIKQGSPESVRNEMAAARLYALANSPTLNYREVEGGKHVATEMVTLAKKSAKELDGEELTAAREEFAVHAWLANWDAVGLEYDNIGTWAGVPFELDLGGALEFRAQGTPKGKAFGTKVTEIETMRDPSVNAQAAAIFGPMTQKQIERSMRRVTMIPDAAIREAAQNDALADKLIARKEDLAKRLKQPPAAKAETSAIAAAWKSGNIAEYGKALLAGCREVATTLSFDPDRVKVSLETKGGVFGTVMAHTDDKSAIVTMFAKHVPPNAYAGTFAHEVQHIRYNAYRNAYKAEKAEVDAALAKMPEAERAATVNADGTLKGEMALKYPIYQRFTALYDMKVLRQEDGVSPYSTGFWKAYDKHEAGPSTSVHETLAEMARLKTETGELPGGPHLQALYNESVAYWMESKPAYKGFKQP